MLVVIARIAIEKGNIMIRCVLRCLFACSFIGFSTLSVGEITQSKVLDEGGSGQYKAVVTTDSALPEFVIYQPLDIRQAALAEQRLPVVIFANGGCNDTSYPFEHMLSDIASHGYLVIALGAMQQRLDDRPIVKASNDMMVDALDWIAQATKDKNSRYFDSADMKRVAYAGQSCGGAQLLAMAEEPRVQTFLMFNSGIGDMTMAQANKSSLLSLHGPVLYLVGGETDVATANALLDYERIEHVPVALANHANAGHSGTFEEPFGGSFSRMAIKWLDWQLKGVSANSATFLANDVKGFSDWSVKAKQFTR
ncbi:alpha/beta hydrolase family protein [Alteromonas gilva]|uniref:Alpha/beta hydrolase n=1 Tax=Alteromonas gilva TaxID=2987522 RepID=A0ABT5L1E0_9ALTE|nr:alpha/beta hydrolase [Alteromonas gilva]MDC8829687.1 alpha/beta hydrolase [Alteromonas gilva]